MFLNDVNFYQQSFTFYDYKKFLNLILLWWMKTIFELLITYQMDGGESAKGTTALH